jgi:hypothetical protein
MHQCMRALLYLSENWAHRLYSRAMSASLSIKTSAAVWTSSESASRTSACRSLVSENTEGMVVMLGGEGVIAMWFGALSHYEA